jgi:hypothetical protein
MESASPSPSFRPHCWTARTNRQGNRQGGSNRPNSLCEEGDLTRLTAAPPAVSHCAAVTPQSEHAASPAAHLAYTGRVRAESDPHVGRRRRQRHSQPGRRLLATHSATESAESAWPTRPDPCAGRFLASAAEREDRPDGPEHAVDSSDIRGRLWIAQPDRIREHTQRDEPERTTRGHARTRVRCDNPPIAGHLASLRLENRAEPSQAFRERGRPGRFRSRDRRSAPLDRAAEYALEPSELLIGRRAARLGVERLLVPADGEADFVEAHLGCADLRPACLDIRSQQALEPIRELEGAPSPPRHDGQVVSGVAGGCAFPIDHADWLGPSTKGAGSGPAGRRE